MTVFNDDRNTPLPEDTTSDGIAISIIYKDEVFSTSSRFTWETWNTVNDSSAIENYKTSYWVMKDRLHEFNTKAIAVCDSLYLEGPDYPVNISEEIGLLQNDFDMDGDLMLALLTEIPQNGEVELNNDGSFSYNPDLGFNGFDSFKYCVFDGYSLSVENTVTLSVSDNVSAINDFIVNDISVKVYPNPSSRIIKVKSNNEDISEIILFDSQGNKINNFKINSSQAKLDISRYPAGNYILVLDMNDKYITKQIIKL